MSAPRDEMELKEEAIRAQYGAAASLLAGFDHAPRLAKASRRWRRTGGTVAGDRDTADVPVHDAGAGDGADGQGRGCQDHRPGDGGGGR